MERLSEAPKERAHLTYVIKSTNELLQVLERGWVTKKRTMNFLEDPGPFVSGNAPCHGYCIKLDSQYSARCRVGESFFQVWARRCQGGTYVSTDGAVRISESLACRRSSWSDYWDVVKGSVYEVGG